MTATRLLIFKLGTSGLRVRGTSGTLGQYTLLKTQMQRKFICLFAVLSFAAHGYAQSEPSDATTSFGDGIFGAAGIFPPELIAGSSLRRVVTSATTCVCQTLVADVCVQYSLARVTDIFKYFLNTDFPCCRGF